MFTSVIIPSFNGACKINNILRALELQNFTDFEVIVVIDGSTDNTIEVVKEYVKNNILNLKYIFQPNGGRAAARNAGVSVSSGELLIFFDDDVRPIPECVKKHFEHHSQIKGSILVGLAKLQEKYVQHDDFSLYRCFIEAIWTKPFYNKITQVSFDNYAFTTQNLSLFRSTFEEIGNFDSRLRDSEDFDLSMRALAKKIPIFYNYHILVWHDDYVSIKQYIQRQKEYLKSKKYLSQIRPEYVQLHPASFNRGNINQFKKNIYRLFIYNSLWENFIQSVFFQKYLPKKLRYKMYSVIVHASSIHSES